MAVHRRLFSGMAFSRIVLSAVAALPGKMFMAIILYFYLASAEIHRAHYETSSRSSADGVEVESLWFSGSRPFFVSDQLLFALLATCSVGCAGILPLLFIPLETGAALRNKDGAAAKTLNNLLCFAVGALLGDVFLHLLPEAYADSDGSHTSNIVIGCWILAGLLVFMLVEMILGEKEVEEVKEGTSTAVNDDVNNGEGEKKDSVAEVVNNNNNNKSGEESKSSSNHVAISGYLNLVANIVDNFTHGLAIGGSYRNSTRLGHLTTFAILLHEIPHEISDFAILLRAGFDRWGAAKAQILTASGSLFGMIVGFHGGAMIGSTSWILPFTSGGFLYISLVTVLPDLMNQDDNLGSAVKQLAFILMGVGSMSLVNILGG